MFLVQLCIADSWSPRIGDPTPLGWLTTFAYLVTAGLSWFTLQYARPSDSVEYRVFWALKPWGSHCSASTSNWIFKPSPPQF